MNKQEKKKTLVMIQKNISSGSFSQINELKVSGNHLETYSQQQFNFIPEHKTLPRIQKDFFDDEERNGVSKKKAFLDANNQLKYTLELEKRYNPHLIPPDWKTAERHGKAKRVGKNKMPSSTQQEEIFEVCPCCDYQIDKNIISLREQVDTLSFLGSGYPLFFHYMKYCIIILGLIILTSGEYNILSNYYGHTCLSNKDIKKLEAKGVHVSSKECVVDIISIFTIANKKQKVDYADIQDILNFTTILVLMILLFFFRKEQKEIDSQCDMAELTPADYTILVRNLPVDTTKKDIRDFFEKGKDLFGQNLIVTEVNFAFDLQERVAKQQNLKQLIEEKKKCLSKMKYDDDFKVEAEKWDKALEKEQINFELINLKIENDPTKFTGYAFVSFQTEDQKQCVLQQASIPFWLEIVNAIFFQTNEFKSLKFKDGFIEVREAPEPLDIIWENLSLNERVKTLRRLLSFFITVILFVVCTVLVYVLIKFQADSLKQFHQLHKDVTDEKSKDFNLKLLFQEQLPSAIVSFCMVCINSVIIEILFRQIVKIECYNTYTLYNINLAQKLSLALFINTALITCIMSVYYTRNVFGKGGLIYTIFYFFVVNAGSSFMSLLFDPMFYLKKILVWWFKRQGAQCTLTQEEANKLCEFPLHEIEIGYVDVMKTMYITIFYSSVVPVGLIISMIGFCFYYWAQKWVILKERTVDKQISMKLSIEMTEYLEFIILIYASSNLLFKYQTVGQISYLQIIGLILGFCYSILPIQLIVEKVFFFGNENEQVNYDVAYPFFVTTYSMSNPITTEKAKKKHYQKVKQQYQERVDV
ncbi:kinase domain protein (macronuclear) [Tetrahymena thermophila SB210]|uniref:Kinase domain protein n=1 Tax=Tetrahymena thermophila (strain SB210) TaxID=312017 RepID=I7M9V3_TETTS|nr:kinase domain protein [Tetrahymena thermophila SB210]EAS02885.2 kinase domain protein [Tetrahymena thermophila SB210]|eukprot:XP_001023130.2 kinase domain protein [Tetrahymena thermophila SB210]